MAVLTIWMCIYVCSGGQDRFRWHNILCHPNHVTYMDVLTKTDVKFPAGMKFYAIMSFVYFEPVFPKKIISFWCSSLVFFLFNRGKEKDSYNCSAWILWKVGWRIKFWVSKVMLYKFHLRCCWSSLEKIF